MARRPANPWDLAAIDASFAPVDAPEENFLEPAWLTGGRGNAPAQYPEIAPEEEKSLLGKTMSAVSWLGESVGKLGYGVRGLAAGEPAAALNFIPFYDTARELTGNVLPEAPKVSGEELLSDKWGIMDKPEGWFTGEGPMGLGSDTFRKLAGVATEFVDPMLAIGGPLGSVTSKGAAAIKGASELAKVGEFAKGAEQVGAALKGASTTGRALMRTPAALAEQVGAGERGILSLINPLTGKVLNVGGQDLTVGAGSKWGQAMWEKLGYGGAYNPVVLARGLFSHVPGVGGQYVGAAQRAADLKFSEAVGLHSAMQNFAPVAAAKAMELQGIWDDAAKTAANAGDPLAYNNFTRAMTEAKTGIPDPAAIAANMGERLAKLPGGNAKNIEAAIENYGGAEAVGKDFYAFFDSMKTLQDQARERINALGGNIAELDDLFGQHMGRRATQSVIEAAQKRYKLGGGADRFRMEKHRAAGLRELPGMTETVNNISRDPVFMGVKTLPNGTVEALSKEVHKEALRGYLRRAGVSFDERMGLEGMQREYLLRQHINPGFDELLANPKLTPEQIVEITKKRVAFTEEELKVAGEGAHPMENLRISGSSPADKVVREFNNLPKDIVRTGLFDRPLVADTFDYMKSAIELESNLQSMHHFLTGPGIVKTIEAMGKEGIEPEGWMPLKEAWKGVGNSDDGLKTWLANNSNMGADASNLLVSPEAVKALAAYKAIRNPRVSGRFGAMMDKITGTYKMWQTFAPSFHTRNGFGGAFNNIAEHPEYTAGILKNIGTTIGALFRRKRSPYLEELAQLGGLGQTQMTDIIGKEIGKAIPEATDVLKEFKTGWGWDAWKIGSSEHPLARGHRQMHSVVEAINRGSYYVTLREHGMAPAEALRYVTKTQFDYGQLSPLERNFMRRLVPYYGWLRNNLPLQFTRLLDRPGGVTGQTLRVMAKSDDREYVPSFMRESLGARLPGGTPEATSFLMQSGLPVEDVNKFIFEGGKPALVRTAEKFISQAHPLAVAGVEALTGKQAFTGRPLDQLHSMTGSRSLDALIHYSPFARPIGGIEKWTDERKTLLTRALNAATGLRIGTYDIEKMRLRDLEQAQQEKLKENPDIRTIEDVYLPKKRAAELAATPSGQARLAAEQNELKKMRGLRAAISKIQKQRDANNVQVGG